jgi:hypothetical protein
MEDGSFTNVDEDGVTLAEDVAIGLCHPLDLGDELITRWTGQLSDYEIKQPVEQLSRKVFRIDEKNKNANSNSDLRRESGEVNRMSPQSGDTVTEFGGAVVYAVSLIGKLQKLGWRKGGAGDAGSYDALYKEHKKQGIDAWLNFSGTWFGADATEEVTVYDVMFNKIDTQDKLKLADIPARLYSEVCYDIERATANRIRTDEGWEKTK